MRKKAGLWLLFAEAGGIVGSNRGTVANSHKLIGRVHGSLNVELPLFGRLSAGGVIGFNDDYEAQVSVSGNTFNKLATGQQWGIGRNNTTYNPSNDGARPID